MNRVLKGCFGCLVLFFILPPLFNALLYIFIWALEISPLLLILLLFLFYLFIINAVTIYLYRSDKVRAENGAWRISEKTLLFVAFIGGGVGALWAMYRYRHKTQKILFTFGVPVCIFLNGLCILFFLSFLAVLIL